MTDSFRSHEEAKWFISTAEELLGDARKPSLVFGMAHIFDRTNIRSAQNEAISEAVAQIAETFDPDKVEADKLQNNFERPGSISVRAANVEFNGNNPLYDQGLPNIFVRKTDDNLSNVNLLYIQDHKDRGISATPSMYPSVFFTEFPGGEFVLDLAPWAPPDFEIPLRHAERLSRVVQLIGAKICSPEIRPQLVVIKSLQ
jgi:hypothetical protein